MVRRPVARDDERDHVVAGESGDGPVERVLADELLAPVAHQFARVDPELVGRRAGAELQIQFAPAGPVPHPQPDLLGPLGGHPHLPPVPAQLGRQLVQRLDRLRPEPRPHLGPRIDRGAVGRKSRRGEEVGQCTPPVSGAIDPGVVRNIDRGSGCCRAGISAQPKHPAERLRAETHHLQERPEQDAEVEPRPAGANVGAVAGDLAPDALDVRVRRQQELRQPGHSRLYRQPLRVPRDEALEAYRRNDFGAFRARADQAHVAAQHVPQLWQFVEVGDP